MLSCCLSRDRRVNRQYQEVEDHGRDDENRIGSSALLQIAYDVLMNLSQHNTPQSTGLRLACPHTRYCAYHSHNAFLKLKCSSIIP